MPRAVRQTQNRDLFRAVNERIADLSAGFSMTDEMQGFICECAHVGCTVQIQLPVEEYGRILATPRAYLVQPGHEDPAAEDILDAREQYLIVVERQSRRPPGYSRRD